MARIRKKTKEITISVSAKVFNELEEKKYNRNKLIVSLLEKYLQKDENNFS
jgi:ribonuclease HIII